MKLHDARLDDFLNIDNGLSTEDTRTPAAIASDIKDAEDKESEQSSSSDDNDLQKTPPTRADAAISLYTIQGYLQSVADMPYHVFSAVGAVDSFLLSQATANARRTT